MCPLYQYVDQYPPVISFFGVDRPSIEERDLDRMRRIGEVEHRDAALVPRLDHDVAPRHRESASRCARRSSPARSAAPASCNSPRTAACGRRCRRSRRRPRSVGSLGAASRPRAAAPFVGEDHLRAVVVESRRVPVGEVLVADLRRAGPGAPDRKCPAGCRCRNRRRPPDRFPERP